VGWEWYCGRSVQGHHGEGAGAADGRAGERCGVAILEFAGVVRILFERSERRKRRGARTENGWADARRHYLRPPVPSDMCATLREGGFAVVAAGRQTAMKWAESMGNRLKAGLEVGTSVVKFPTRVRGRRR